MAAGIVEISVYLGIGAIIGIILGYYIPIILKSQKNPPQGKFEGIKKKIRETGIHLEDAHEILEQLHELFDELEHINKKN